MWTRSSPEGARASLEKEARTEIVERFACSFPGRVRRYPGGAAQIPRLTAGRAGGFAGGGELVACAGLVEAVAGGVRFDGARTLAAAGARSLGTVAGCTGAELGGGAGTDACVAGEVTGSGVGSALGAPSGGPAAALSDAAGVASDLKCDQMRSALPITKATPPSNATSGRLELRFGTPAASSWVADRPATDWLGTADDDPARGPETADTGPERSAALVGPEKRAECGPALPSQMRLSSEAASRAEPKRCAKSRLQTRANQASKPAGTGPKCEGTGMGRAQIANSKPPSVSSSNGRRPSKHSKAITPMAQMSLR